MLASLREKFGGNQQPTGMNGAGPARLKDLQQPLPRGRRAAVTALGIVLALACGAGAVGLVAVAGSTEQVVAVARPVAYGERLAAADLTTSGIDPDSVFDAVPAQRLDTMVGKVAVADLAAGSLLTPGQVADRIPLSDGMQVVPLPVRPTQFPADGLRPRDQVLVVATPVVDGEPPQDEPDRIAATVLSVGGPDDAGTRMVDVLATAEDGPRLAALAATGRIGLVIQPREQAGS